MLPIRKGDGTGLSVPGYSEVRKGDGTVLWSAGAEIPDSEANQKLVHRWVLNDVNGTVEDSEGGADGTNNGVTSVSGEYAGGSAGDGDGTDNIETTTWGSFGSNMDSDFAIAFTIDPPATEGVILGVSNDGDTTDVDVRTDDAFLGTAGTLTFTIRGSSDGADYNSIESSTDITSGGPYRVVINKTGNSAEDIDIWVNQSNDGATVNENLFDETSTTDFDTPVTLFARNVGGSVGTHIDTILDDICIYDDSLTQTEIEGYENPWESSSTTDYFATATGTQDFGYSSNNPQAHYVASEDWTFAVGQGQDENPYAFAYDFANEEWTNEVKIGDNPLTSPDNHGSPAAIVDANGYVHVFFGAHNDPFQYHVSSNPYDITSWDDEGTVGSSATYPQMNYIDGSIVAFYRYDNGSYRPIAMADSTDDGATWTDDVVKIDLGSGEGAHYLSSAVRISDTELLITWSTAPGGPTFSDERGDLFAAIYDVDADSFSTVGGTSLGSTIDSGDYSDVFVYDSGTDNLYGSSGIQIGGSTHIVFTQWPANDKENDTFTIRHIEHDGSSWGSPEDVCIASDDTTPFLPVVGQCADIGSSIRIVAAEVEDSTTAMRRFSHDGSDWVVDTTILDAGQSDLPFALPTPVVDGPNEMQLLIGTHDRERSLTERWFAWGDNGLVERS